VNLAAPNSERKQPGDFLFRGNAIAGSGFLTRMKGKAIAANLKKPTVHGESSLPMAGGVSRSLVRKPKLPFPEFIRYSDCETFVMGAPEGDSMVTTLRASVKNVRVATAPSPEDGVPEVALTAFEAASLSLAVRSTHPPTGEPEFEILKETQGLDMFLAVTNTSGEIARTPIRLTFDTPLLALRTLGDLDNAFLGNPDFFDQHCACFGGRERFTYGESRIPRTQHGYVFLPIVKQVELGDRTVEGNTLAIPGFGTISFGVMVTDQISRRISLVRIRFGSDPGGSSCLPSVETNGIWQ
jgi:hypothetical protein